MSEDRDVAKLLEAALEEAEDERVQYHVRQALQQPAIRRGEVEADADL